MTTVGVVPAAGHALRLQPLDRSKEMLEVGGRPVIDYVVERMRAGGAERLRVVIRPQKEDVIAYAHSVGAEVVLGTPATINESLAAGLEGIDPDDVVLIGFPDSLWQPGDGFARLVGALEEDVEVALGLFEVKNLSGSDYLELDDAGRIVAFHVKPERPPSDWIWGCAAARRGVLDGIEREEWPSVFLDGLRRRGVGVAGVPLSDTYLDIGTPESLVRLSELTWLS